MLSGFFEGGRFCARPIKTISITTFNVKDRHRAVKPNLTQGLDFVLFDIQTVCGTLSFSTSVGKEQITVTYMNPYVE